MALADIRDKIHADLSRVLVPVARLAMRAGITPNQVSVAGVAVNFAAAWLIVTEQFVAAGLLYLAAGVFDLLDGVLAREAGRVSAFGAFLDSTLDRVSEGIVLSAIAYRFALDGRALDAGLAAIAVVGSLLVSYTRARAEGLGAECKVGGVTRAERVILVTVGLLSGLLGPAIYILIVLSAFTTGQRILHTFHELSEDHEAGGAN